MQRGWMYCNLQGEPGGVVYDGPDGGRIEVVILAAEEHDAREAEIERVEKENTFLRGLVHAMKIPCIHCGLEDMSKCESGFPGCAQADDIFCAEQECLPRLRNQLAAREAMEGRQG